jgi:thiol:disulfide interchange protein
MKIYIFLISFFSIFCFGQIFEPNADIPEADEAFKLSASYDEQSLSIKFDLAPNTYLYFQKIIMKGSEIKNLNPIFEATIKNKDDIFFGKVQIIDSSFKISLTPNLEKKIILMFQGCFQNKVCYPAQKNNILIKYREKKISSVKISKISSKI